MNALDELARLPAPVPPSLSAELEAELTHLAPVTTRRPIRQVIVLIAVSLIYGAGFVGMLARRRDFHELPMGWLAGVGVMWLAGFVVPLYLATVPRPGSVAPRWRLAGISSVVAAAGFVGLGLAFHPSGPSSFQSGWAHFGRGHSCLELGLAVALVPVVVGAIFLRGALTVGSRWAAAALGAGGGSLGGLILHLHCPVTDGLHVGLVHGGVVGAAALLAAAIVPRAVER